jgi:hypothetical protein
MPWRRQISSSSARAGPLSAGRDHHQALDFSPPAFGRDAEHGLRRYDDDRQVDVLGQRGRRRQAGDAVQLGRVRVDRIDRAGETSADDVAQDGPADRAGAPARPDDRDRGRGQHRPHARHVGRLLPYGDRIPVGAQRGIRLAGRQREREVVRAIGQGAVHR